MKSLLICALGLAAVCAAADPSVAGEWQVYTAAAGNENTQTCTFTQKETELGGTCNTRGGPVPVTGKIEGSAITWTYKTDSQAGPVTVVFKGKVESATKMSGGLTALEFGVEGEFSATRAK
jgi:hypothetical protein